MAFYAAGRHEEAYHAALRAYLEGVEPVERRLRSDDPKIVADLEQDMANVRSAIQDTIRVRTGREFISQCFAI